MSKPKKILAWILRIAVSVIYLQTLFFKFTGAPESVFIFETLGVEPWGRYLIAFAELVVAIMILLPKTVLLGALGSLGMIGGAILSHFLFLGVEVQGDGGTLFILAVVILVASSVVAFLHKNEKS